MDERQRLLRAIEAEPDDDTVRLVFADWLEENGEADRSRFVRLQCEHYRLYGPLGSREKLPNRIELEREINRLLKKHREEWTAGLPAWARKEEFRRGFLHLWSMTCKQFLDVAGPLRHISPLDTLALRRIKGCEAAVFGSEHLSGVGRLWLTQAQLNDEGTHALVASPHLGQVRWLQLGRTLFGAPKDANSLTDASAVALARADNLPALTRLDLSGYKRITAAGLRAIVESERRAGLEELNVSSCADGRAVAELFHLPTFLLAHLTKLMLNDMKLGDAGIRTLAENSTLRILRVLWLTYNDITDRGATSFAEAADFVELEELDLWQNKLTDAGVRAILGSPGLRGVRRLDLGENRGITDASALAILDDGRPWEKVGLKETRVSDALRQQIEERCKRNRPA